MLPLRRDLFFLLDPLCPSLDSLVTTEWPNQRRLSDALHLSRFKALLREVAVVDRRHEAWLRSCSSFGSCQWLQALPAMRCFSADADEYRVMLCSRLLVSMSRSSSAEMPYCACESVHDAGFSSGAHWHSKCKHGPVLSSVMSRHDSVRDILAAVGREVPCWLRRR